MVGSWPLAAPLAVQSVWLAGHLLGSLGGIIHLLAHSLSNTLGKVSPTDRQTTKSRFDSLFQLAQIRRNPLTRRLTAVRRVVGRSSDKQRTESKTQRLLGHDPLMMTNIRGPQVESQRMSDNPLCLLHLHHHPRSCSQ